MLHIFLLCKIYFILNKIMSLTVIPIPPQIVIPAAVASVVTTNLQVETTPAVSDAKVPKYITAKFYKHPNQQINHQDKNPYIGAAASAGTSIVTSNVSMGSLPSAQFAYKPFKDSIIGPTKDSNNVMPDGSTMVGHPGGDLLASGSACLGNQQPCYDGTSTTGNQPIFRKEILVGLTGQKLYHFRMGSTNSVGNHSSIYYNPLTEKALTSDGYKVSPGFTVSH
jgi:hypothetical protein